MRNTSLALMLSAMLACSLQPVNASPNNSEDPQDKEPKTRPFSKLKFTPPTPPKSISKEKFNKEDNSEKTSAKKRKKQNTDYKYKKRKKGKKSKR